MLNNVQLKALRVFQFSHSQFKLFYCIVFYCCC